MTAPYTPWANGIVENLDFFDASVYSEDIERFDPEDEDDVDVTEHEKRKEVFNLYENLSHSS